MLPGPVLFEPVIDLTTGRVVAHQATTGPTLAAAQATLRQASAVPTPLHVPVSASEVATVADAAAALAAAAAGPHPSDVLLQLTEVDAVADLVQLRRRCARLRALGFGLAIGGVGDRHASLRLVTEARPRVVKLGPVLVAALADDSDEAAAIVEALALCCHRVGARLVADAIATIEQLQAVLSAGVGFGQGPLFGAPGPGPQDEVVVPKVRAAGLAAATGPDGAVIRDLMRRPVTAPADASGEVVRELFGQDESVLTVVLVDADARPVGAVHRSRLMVAASGPFGHALNARRSATQHASAPRVVAPDTPVREAVGVVAARSGNRIYDDLVVADERGRCVGVVRVYDLLTAVHSAQLNSALDLDAVTGMPAGRAIADTLRARLADEDGVAVHWIDVAGYRAHAAEAGFLAGDAVLKDVGRTLRSVAAVTRRGWAGHVGGGHFVLLTTRDDAEVAIRGLLGRLPDASLEVAAATLDCAPGAIADPEEASRQLAKVHEVSRQAAGQSWAVGSAWDPHVRLHMGRAPEQAATRSSAAS